MMCELLKMNKESPFLRIGRNKKIYNSKHSALSGTRVRFTFISLSAIIRTNRYHKHYGNFF